MASDVTDETITDDSSTDTDYTAYQDALLALLPMGDAWIKEADSELGKLMAGAAEEFARIDQRAIDLLTESHPSTAEELFEEWENQYGLPDDCCTTDQTDEDRVYALIQSYQTQGGQSKAFFIEVAALLGVEITITEYRQRYFGDDFNELYASTDWTYTWQVNTKVVNFRNMYYGESYNQVYRQWVNERLECVFQTIKPAHLHLIFSYS